SQLAHQSDQADLTGGKMALEAYKQDQRMRGLQFKADHPAPPRGGADSPADKRFFSQFKHYNDVYNKDYAQKYRSNNPLQVGPELFKKLNSMSPEERSNMARMDFLHDNPSSGVGDDRGGAMIFDKDNITHFKHLMGIGGSKPSTPSSNPAGVPPLPGAAPAPPNGM